MVLLGAALCLAAQTRVGFAQAPQFEWAIKAGGTGSDAATAIVMDAATNLYVAGYFFGTATFGTTNITAASTNIDVPNFFLAKYNRAGNVEWVKGLGGCCASGQSLTGIALDGAGNIYMAGQFRGTLSMGDFTQRSDYAYHIFVAKLSNDGTVVWLEQGGDTFRHVGCSGMAADANGNLYITGGFDTTATFGHVTLEGNAGYQVKYGPLGNVLWARALGPRHPFRQTPLEKAGQPRRTTFILKTLRTQGAPLKQ